MDRARPRVWTAANILSLLRVVLVPVLVLALAARRPGAALIIFAVAGSTDFLDGLAARALHQRTSLGVLLDPIGDKLLMTAAFITLSLPSLPGPNVIPLWLTIPVIGRDVAIVLGAFILFKTRGVRQFPPSLWGKVSTVGQMACLGLVLLFNWIGTTPSALTWVYVATLTATLVSGGDYFRKGFLGGRVKAAG